MLVSERALQTENMNPEYNSCSFTYHFPSELSLKHFSSKYGHCMHARIHTHTHTHTHTPTHAHARTRADPKLVKMTAGCGISHTILKTHI
jgi:carbohydrate-binding DOMON domain-containing protein